jgi:murein DD-endopeptidase MepM/ murein hydrolase activator NlpD
MLSKVDSISEINTQLRLAANLEPISEEEKLVGTGGSLEFFSSNTNIKDNEIKNLLKSVDEMIGYVNFEKAQSIEISRKLQLNEKLHQCIPAIKPTVGHYSINDFGIRKHPILGVRRFHEGIDINCDYGTDVRVPGDGKVVTVERRAGFGLVVEVDHGFGYKTVYAHLSNAMVKKGDFVTRGQKIAKSGNSGLSTGPHLHYEVHHDGISIDPTDFFFDDLTFFDLDSSKSTSQTEK